MKRTGPNPEMVEQINDRDHGICRRCNSARGEQIQHRRPRKKGGTRRPEINDASNLVLVCQPCHDDIEDHHRAEAYVTGWLVKEGIEDPESIPLVDLQGRQFFLTDDGGVIEVSPAGFLPGDPAMHLPPF